MTKILAISCFIAGVALCAGKMAQYEEPVEIAVPVAIEPTADVCPTPSETEIQLRSCLVILDRAGEIIQAPLVRAKESM